MSFLPNGDNATVLTGYLYGRKPSETRPSSFGLVRTFTYTPEVEEAELENNNSGVNALIKTRSRTVGATVSLVLDELTARNLAMALMAEEADLTQTGETGISISESNIVAGQITRLSGRNVSNLSLQDDQANTLVEGQHYRLESTPGYIRWLVDLPSVTGTCDTGSVDATANMTTLSLLQRVQGTEVFLTLIPTNEGPQTVVEDVLVQLRPSGAISFTEQGSDFQSLELEGKALRNLADDQHPFGRVIHLPPA
ncbi:hypothetical protein DLJ49_18765 [Rhodovulum sp. 12E13]|uniref:phage tail tube protein n=1 Tax=Rhodovulum sp. 12E13 TaxID=2203891 RepID=UPI000E15A99D|nr:hypothetical protein [Rhodovulum sp. 12E13]RDC69682.1 hypothetical protein DLJ49_18765 [Rhodovulum sp. 12E13]